MGLSRRRVEISSMDRAVVLAQRGYDLALNVLDDVGVVLALNDHDQGDMTVQFRECGIRNRSVNTERTFGSLLFRQQFVSP